MRTYFSIEIIAWEFPSSLPVGHRQGLLSGFAKDPVSWMRAGVQVAGTLKKYHTVWKAVHLMSG